MPALTPTPDAPPVSCLDWLGTPIARGGFFRDRADTYWLLARRPRPLSPAQYELQLLRVDLSAGSTSRLLGVNQTGWSPIVPHGQAPDGVTILSGSGWENQCSSSVSSLVTISLDSTPKNKPIKLQGRYGLLRGGSGYIVDSTRHGLIEVDTRHLQQQLTARFDPDSFVIAADLEHARLISFNPTTRLVQRWIRGAKTAEASAKLPERGKILVGGENSLSLAFAEILPKTNTLIVREFSDWSDTLEPKTVSIEVPAETPLKDAAFEIFPALHRVVIYPVTDRGRAQWGKVYFADYSVKNFELLKLTLPAGMAVGQVDVSRDGQVAVIEMREATTGVAKGLAVFSFKHAAWKQIDL
jgi:hypothetical protein